MLKTHSTLFVMSVKGEEKEVDALKLPSGRLANFPDSPLQPTSNVSSVVSLVSEQADAMFITHRSVREVTRPITHDSGYCQLMYEEGNVYVSETCAYPEVMPGSVGT